VTDEEQRRCRAPLRFSHLYITISSAVMAALVDDEHVDDAEGE
jgi:hypothetical protein